MYKRISLLLRYNFSTKLFKPQQNTTNQSMQIQQPQSKTLNSQLKGVWLTETQKIIFKTLKDSCQELKLKTIMRVAGGWVRDKLMNKQSHDIDIALDDMDGQEFLKMIKTHSEQKALNGQEGQKISGFGVTKFNPELSKHLKTATAKIHGQSLDFVNLRSQKYSEDSRIPVIVNDIGTPLQDALRRDFTINSLFYNINSDEIEDWTQKGKVDLQNGILRTPLQPLETFKDDPLRVLRCFRFKARFDFTIDKEIYKALEVKDIHEALRTKVSKQRIGIEIWGTLKSNHPLSALVLIKKYDYWNILFEVPKQSDLAKQPELISIIPEISYSTIEKVLESLEKNKFITQQELTLKQGQVQKVDKKQPKKKSKYSQQQLHILIRLSCLLVCYRDFKVDLGKGKFETLVNHIVKVQLKYSTKVAKFIQGVCNTVTQLQRLISLENNEQKKFNKNGLIKWLRLAEEKWEIAIHILSAINQIDKKHSLLSPLEIRDYVFENALENTYLVESWVDGTFLGKKGIKGPIVRIVLENCTIWRVLHPESTKEQFLETFENKIEFFKEQKAYN